jgi:hypothetical protein
MIKFTYLNDDKYTYEHREIICDTCGKSTDTGELIPVRLEFSYGNDLDGNLYDFCNFKCLKIFIDAELKKETK